MTDNPKRKWSAYTKIYLYMLGLALMLFGIFAIYFRTYDHPIYGRLDLGEYNVSMGIASFLVGGALTAYTSYRCNR